MSNQSPHCSKCLHNYHSLSGRDRHILRLYLVSRMPWSEITRELGVSRERIRQIKNRIFWKLDLDLEQEKRRTSLAGIAMRNEHCKEYQRMYYKGHREKKLAYSRRYREAHREEIRVKDRDYYRKNKERMLETTKSYHRTHPERIRAISRKYYYAHRDEILARAKVKREKCKKGNIEGE